MNYQQSSLCICSLILSSGLILIGSVLLGQLQFDIQYFPIQGGIFNASCLNYCLFGGCHVIGNVTLAFNFHNQSYLTPTYYSDICDPDCCQTIISDELPIWILLKNDNPEDIQTYSLNQAYDTYYYLIRGSICLGIAFIILLLTGLILVYWSQKKFKADYVPITA